MKTDLTKPCAKCPFRTDCLRGWLGEDRAQEIADSILGDASFPCHETTEFDEHGESTVGNDKEQHCAGAMILLEKMERPNQWMRWMERLGMYDRRKLDMAAPVFCDETDFVLHHAERLRKKVRKRREARGRGQA